MVDLFGTNCDEVKGIVYDPFIISLSNEGNLQAKVFEKLQFIVEIFHAKKRTMPKCFYHPHLDKFANVCKMTTEIAEQSFSQINPFRYITRRMLYGTKSEI